jgi:NDP-sugar pyrophosphorylase family protein
MDQALKAGFNKIFFIVGEKTQEPFYLMFGDSYNGIPVRYIKQDFDILLRDKPWGTCDALCTLKGVVDCPFVVCNGDDIYGEDAFRLLLNHLKSGSNDCVTLGYNLLKTLPERGSVNRGIFNIAKDGCVIDIDETINIFKDKLNERGISSSSLVSMNIFGLYPEVIEMLDEKLSTFKKNNCESKDCECYLPSELSNLIYEGKIKMKCFHCDDNWFGVTNPEDEKIVKEQLLRHLRKDDLI